MPLDVESIQQTFEVHNTAVSPQELAHRIAANLQAHQLQTPTRWATFAVHEEATTQTAVPAAEELTLAFEQAVKTYDKISVENVIPASDLSLLARIKRPFHQLVTFYVNLLGQKQIRSNDRLLRLMQQLITADAQKTAEIKQLRSELTELQKKLQQLEQRDE